MNIFIAGGGRVGVHLARLLCIEGHDVTVIESDPSRVEQVDTDLDVRTVAGDAVSVMLLKEAGAAAADLFVAATGFDEGNLISAAAAKGLGATQVVARVDRPNYVGSTILYETVLNIDYVLSPQALTALEIARFVENPGTVAAEEFGRGLVQMRHIRVAQSPTRDGKRLKDVCPPGSGVLLGVISRTGVSFVPHGDDTVEAGDLVTLIGRHDRISLIEKQFHGTETKAERVVIMGGGSIGSHLAQLLEKRRCSVKLFDRDMARCTEVAAKSSRVKVVCRDATTRSALEQEHVDNAELFVATTGDDEHNIMASVLAKEVGVRHTVAVVHQPDFAPLVCKLGVDHAVTPRASFANRILRLVHQKTVSTLAVLEEGQIEILEFPVTKETAITGKTLSEIRGKLPREALVATILRGEHVIVPSGDDQIQVNDSVIMIAKLDCIDAVQKLFQ